jgi:hypothetical protein
MNDDEAWVNVCANLIYVCIEDCRGKKRVPPSMGPHTLVPPTSLPRSFPAHARSTSCSADASGPGCPHRPIATLPLPAETTRGTHHPPLALASAARRARIKRPPCPSPAPPPTHAPRASRDLLLPPPAFDSAAASSGTAEVREILPVSSRDLIICLYSVSSSERRWTLLPVASSGGCGICVIRGLRGGIRLSAGMGGSDADLMGEESRGCAGVAGSRNVCH